jgi:hypothetical protein
MNDAFASKIKDWESANFYPPVMTALNPDDMLVLIGPSHLPRPREEVLALGMLRGVTTASASSLPLSVTISAPTVVELDSIRDRLMQARLKLGLGGEACFGVGLLLRDRDHKLSSAFYITDCRPELVLGVELVAGQSFVCDSVTFQAGRVVPWPLEMFKASFVDAENDPR